MQLIELIKEIAVNAVEATKPAGIYTGRVTDLEPLTVQITPKMVLSKQLMITNTVQTLIDDGELKVGDKVTLDRVQGGQRFRVTDKLTGD